MIIDAHVHIHPDRHGFGDKYDASLDFLLDNMRNSGVDRAVILPIATSGASLRRVENSFVGEVCARHAGLLWGFASVDPSKGKDACKELEDAVGEYALVGLKLHPRYQGIAINDQRLIDVVGKAAELGIPVAIDTLIWKPTPLRFQDPLLVDDVAKAVPEAKIIMCHMGGYRFMDALFVAVANDNVYLDVSVTAQWLRDTPFEEQFKYAIRQIGSARVIYGSDHPERPLKDSYNTVRKMFEEFMDDREDLDRIFGLNIMRLIQRV